MKQALSTKRNLLEQTLRATFNLQGSWLDLDVWLIGDTASKEKGYFLSKGVTEDNLKSLSLESLFSQALESFPKLLLIHLDEKDCNSYTTLLDLLGKIRDLPCDQPRLINLECGVIGSKDKSAFGDPNKNLKSIYVELIHHLEDSMPKDEFVVLHDKLLSQIKEEDEVKRFLYILDEWNLSAKIQDKKFKALILQAQLRLIEEDHGTRTFESGLIASSVDELKKIQKLLLPSQTWKDFSAKVESAKEPGLVDHSKCLSGLKKDANLPQSHSDLWNALEKEAGVFFDYHCGKAFNRLSPRQKYNLTRDLRHEEKKQSVMADEPVALDLSANFNKFKLDSDPFSGLMGGGLSPSSTTPPVSSNEPHFSLEEYGEVFLSMLAAWHRQRVHIGGALHEYNYDLEDDTHIMGYTFVLNTDKKLMLQVNSLSAQLGLPKIKKKIDPKQILESFFAYDKDYIIFYDKIRSRLKKNTEYYLGKVSEEDYSVEKIESAPAFIVSKDRVSKNEKLKRSSDLTRSGYNSRIKQLREDRQEKFRHKEQESEKSLPEDADEGGIVLEMTEEEIIQAQEELELKRMHLEEKIAEKKKKQLEMEEARHRLKEEQERRRREYEVKLQKKKDEEKASRLIRQQKIAKDKSRRDEVKQARVDSLKNAFDRAREMALKKKEHRIAMKNGEGGKASKAASSQKSQKKILAKEAVSQRKGFNPDAVKMMIRFGTDTAKIQKNTGLTLEEIEKFRSDVHSEDGKI